MNSNLEEEKLSIGSWTIKPESGILETQNGNEIYLEPRLAKLFYLLFKNSNRLVTRKQLIDEIWNDTVVNDESLTRAISDLRRVLQKNFDTPPEIKTIHKRGYKMLIPNPPIKSSALKVTFKYILYIIVIFILLILVIRGLNY